MGIELLAALFKPMLVAAGVLLILGTIWEVIR